MFRAFDNKIALNDTAKQPGMRRLIDCSNKLLDKYFPQGTNLNDEISLIGSLAKDTGIKPLHDADVLFHMPPGTYGRFDAYTSNGQSALLQEVRDTLKAKYPRSDIRGDGPVVTVKFTDEPWVEVVPAVLVPSESNILYADVWVPVTTNGGSWEQVGYGQQLRTLDAADRRIDGQLRRLIRYAKAWRQHSNATLKSIVLELMAIHFTSTWDTTQTSHTWDDWILRDFLEYMVDNYLSTYAIPGSNKKIGTGTGWLHKAMDARDAAVLACTYGPETFDYGYHWRKVLGDAFGR